MSWEPIETSLDTIERGLTNLNEDSLSLVLKALDRFQQDPLVLIHRGVLTGYVSLLCGGFFELTKDDKLLRCKVFYSIAKVVSWKRSVRYLPIDVYLLKKLMPLLEEQEGENWYVQFFILSWIYVLCLSPFKLEIDEKLYQLVAHCRTPVAGPLVVNIRSQLLSKNELLLRKYRDELDVATLNGILKIVLHQENALVDSQMLDKFSEECLNGPVDVMKLKILPKLFLMYARDMDVGRMQGIITWIVSQFGSDFTDMRFAVAHCYAKIVKIVIEELEEEEMFGLLVENCLDPTVEMLKFEPWDVLDQDRLHTYLLVIAELSTTIVKHSSETVGRICQDIIPYACKFQQLRANTIKGSQLRDASNFICWSLARARVGKKRLRMEDLNSVFLNVLMCSLFDRELLIRKSANAALQEILGRYVTFTGMLDNRTILQIIELPINNLPKHITTNTLQLYKILGQNDERYANFMIHWLFDSCIMENHDLSVVQWTTWTLCQWAAEKPSRLESTGILSRISGLGELSTHKTSRLLYLLVQMRLHGLPWAAVRHLHVISQQVLDATRDMQFRRNDYDLFQFMAIFTYGVLMLQDDQSGFTVDMQFVDLIFRMLRGFTPSIRFHEDVVSLLRVLLSVVSNVSTKFASLEVETKFWYYFEQLIRSNNSCCCCSFAAMEPHRFVKIFRSSLPLMDCQGKSQILDAFQAVGSFRNMVREDKYLLTLLAKLLDDYTITEQGDIGRLVRASAARIVLKNQDLFMKEPLSSQVVSSLMRLSGEPSEEIRNISLQILHGTEEMFAKYKIDFLQLIRLQSSKFKVYLNEFWKGFLMSAGAIHSSENQIRSAIDSFLCYYRFLPTDCERLQVCNDLVRIIPSAKWITESKSQQKLEPETGIVDQDILKITVSYINFWRRILESGLRIDSNFNFQGFYAKLYNLHLLNGASLLRLTIVGFFAQLVISLVHSKNFSDRKLINSVIERLLTVMKREASRRRKPMQTPLEQECLKALAAIFLELNLFSKLQKLVKCSDSKEELLDSPISMFTV